VLARQGRSDKPDSSQKTITRRCRAPISLARPTSCSSTYGPPLRRVAALAVPDVVDSTPSFAAFATRKTVRTSHRSARGSARQFAATSTSRSRIRPRARRDLWLTEKIEAIHRGSRGVYGSPMIHSELADEHGVRVGRKRVARLMRAAGLRGASLRRFVITTTSDPKAKRPPDLVDRRFYAEAPNPTLRIRPRF
jgi:hypothetical protein